ncbi:MAG: PSD1 and planctomycete cytochrome C domain-containing protein [Planctomycetota bacterium]|nr:PSD1 and planctomycete cytochrome C domain-containing protein [Planctomycetota bacterium]
MILGLLGALTVTAVARPGSDEEFFESRVRPVLVAKCQRCHGPKKQKASLRLDSRAAVLKGGESGPAVVPGRPEKSLLIRAVRRVDPDLRMPPKGELSAAEIEALERWVTLGAPWSEVDGATLSPELRVDEIRRTHWAFRPVRRGEVPDVRAPWWARSAIDRYVLSRLEAADLRPSPPAERRTLIRRAFLDLIGLPPTYDEVESFVNDPSPGAFAAVVDRLLARPEYGERWGRHWLDVARYADTKGYVDAGERRYPFAFTYRDYVIRAFAGDLPFDRFILEQLAADRLLEKGGGEARGRAGAQSLAALGFLTVGQRFNFFPHEVIDDRIDVVSRGFLGLTVTCARCHDHKYDPIPTTDYYALYGVFASSAEPTPDEMPVLVPRHCRVPEPEAFRKELGEKAAALKKRRRELHRQIAHEMRAWAGDYLRYIVQLMPEHRTRAQPMLRTKRGLLREVTAYGRGGVGRWRRYVENCGADDPVFGFWNRVVALPRDEVKGRAPALLADLRRAGPVNVLVAQAFAEKAPATMVDVADVYGRLLEETEALWSARRKEESAADRFDDAAREQLRQVLHGPGSPAVFSLDVSEDLYHLDEHTDVRTRFAEVERVYLKAKTSPLPRAMALHDRPEPLETRVFRRGDPERLGARVDRRFLSVLSHVRSEPFTRGSGRLELAEAIADPRNPLTARVLVNRVWAWHFGRGLVDTASDFGLRSSPPSHPGLLDHLAARVVEDGWSLKKLHRLILLSSTWQQSSVDRADGRSVDPENRLLWRMNRRRLDFEAMRDSMLAVAGRLDRRAGGPPLERPPDDPENRRRTVYGLVDRELLPGVFRTFDFPSPDLSAPERSRTTVPQQALFLLNSPFVIAQAEGLAEVTDTTTARADREGRIRALYRRVYGRDPSLWEVELGARFLASHSAKKARPERRVAPGAAQWKYGYGEVDAEKGRLKTFTPLPHFTGDSWQGGPAWPDAELHYLRLTRTGGHVGIDRGHAAVRRWVAPRDGVVGIRGRLTHGEEDCGDGVEARVLSSTMGSLGHWTVYKSSASTELQGVAVKAGSTMDFVVDCRANHGCDLFEWAPVIRFEPAAGEMAGSGPAEWDAARDFGGPEARRGFSSPWAEYAQVLLQSNEFLFAD